MKKLFLLMTCVCLSVTHLHVYAGKPAPVLRHYIAEEWTKAKDGVWEGVKDKKTYWYKLDKDAKLWWSANGKKWAAVDDGMWADADGKWLKIVDGKLMWSADNGGSWAEVPDWKWEGPKGHWYKFDKEWSVWVARSDS